MINNKRVFFLGGQGLAPNGKYVAVFDRMESVVFFNGEGQEEQIWKTITGGSLGPRHTEGTDVHSCTALLFPTRPPEGRLLL